MSQKQVKRARRKEKQTANRGFIKLQNPVAQHFDTFIFGNATKCDVVVEEDSAKGQHLVLCGAGPSLAEHADEWCPQGDQVWGCNSALQWLDKHGHKPTHGFCIDQTPHMVAEWLNPPDVEYIIASSVHPNLTDMLLQHGRKVRFFHNFVGIDKPPVAYDDAEGVLCEMDYEDWLYSGLYPPTIRAGSGLNSVTRAIDVAGYMGFDKITVLGADCCLRFSRPVPDVPHGSPEHLKWLSEDVVMHADGGNALVSGATATTIAGEIDGRTWLTKPDMMITAVWLTQMKKHMKDRLNLVGDTLPNAIQDKPQEFMDRLPQLVDRNNRPLRFVPA